MKKSEDCVYVNHSVICRCRKTGRVILWGKAR